jgi:hypothetical protein
MKRTPESIVAEAAFLKERQMKLRIERLEHHLLWARNWINYHAPRSAASETGANIVLNIDAALANAPGEPRDL